MSRGWWDCESNLKWMPHGPTMKLLSGPYGGGLGDMQRWLEVAWPQMSVAEALFRKRQERRELV